MWRQPVRGAGPQSEVCRELKTAGLVAIGPLVLMAGGLKITSPTAVSCMCWSKATNGRMWRHLGIDYRTPKEVRQTWEDAREEFDGLQKQAA